MMGCQGSCSQGRKACNCEISFPPLKHVSPDEPLPESEDPIYPLGALPTWAIAFLLVMACAALFIGPEYARMLVAAL